MAKLYVQTHGAKIHRDGERIVVTEPEAGTRRNRKVASMPVRDIEQVVLYGNVQVTGQAAALLLEHDIEVLYHRPGGRFLGRLVRDGSRYARLRHRQLGLVDKPGTTALAKAIVRAKLRGQSGLLGELSDQTAGNAAGALTRAMQDIDAMRRAAAHARSVDAVRGYEGKGSALYFGALRQVIAPTWSFQGRQFHPPPDPVNAMLSFGYTILQNEIEGVIQSVGLDPYVGCLHTLEYGRPSLVLDLMEEFRPLVVDRAVLGLILGNKVQPADFTFTNRAERPVELGKKLIPVMVQAYEARVNDSVLHRPSNAQQRLRYCYELQVRLYARTVLGERREFEGVLA